jgi:hypothetical protein
VLCVGAATGEAARLIGEKQCRVSAIEIDPVASRLAAGWCDRVVTGDVEHLDLHQALGEEPFDAVVVLNVLERLREPTAVAARLVELLAAGGRFVAAISNVAHAAVRFDLLRGRFPGTAPGLLDHTQLHHFDRPAAEALFASAGLDVVERLRVRRGPTETEIEIDLGEFPPAVVEAVLSDPDAETYQFVLIGTPRLEHGVRSLPSLATAREARQLSRERDSLTAALESAERRAFEMATRLAELTSVQDELRYLRSDLEIKDAYTIELQSELVRVQDQCRIEADRRVQVEAQLAAVTARASYRLIQRLEQALAARPMAERVVIALTRRLAP